MLSAVTCVFVIVIIAKRQIIDSESILVNIKNYMINQSD